MMPSDFDLLRVLDDEPRTPSTVDVQRAMADGRRRRRNRRAGYAGAATATAFAVVGASLAVGGLTGERAPAPAATGKPKPSASGTAKPKGSYTIPGTPGWKPAPATAPSSCRLEVLPTPDGEPMALVSGGDPTGKYLVGRSYPKGGGYVATYWADGKATKVDLPGDLEESLREVNSAGTAVGWSYEAAGESTRQLPYAYHQGKIVKLAGVKSGAAEAINEAGAIVGQEADKYAVVWPSATAKAFRLPVPAGTTQSAARDIDEDGTVIGNVGDGRDPYVWFPDGTHQPLPMPEIDGKPAGFANVSVIRNGWATGVAGPTRDGATGNPKARAEGARAGREMQAFRWNVRTGEVQRISGFDSAPDAMNAQGWVVGIDDTKRAVLVADGTRVSLPDLAANEVEELTNIPNSISDDGRTIGGQSDDKNDVIQAVVWHCE